MCVVSDIILCLEDKWDQEYLVLQSTSTKLKCVLVRTGEEHFGKRHLLMMGAHLQACAQY